MEAPKASPRSELPGTPGEFCVMNARDLAESPEAEPYRTITAPAPSSRRPRSRDAQHGVPVAVAVEVGGHGLPGRAGRRDQHRTAEQPGEQDSRGSPTAPARNVLHNALPAISGA
ncbi:hypothetical protein SHKM778_01100 [Streptomyces sp. KM77-8]|uniref:DUF397 domain-containing protein n=1 Tax=Streptomyces haneummycinicus TaxID=3074435 RepID=A0AAT9H8K0_9ACTN